ncbi:MAG: DUF2027 domain-containing protein [Bacteroidota bacterium]
MKKLRAGDEVAFLNEKGRGVVISLFPDETALVRTDDGFEHIYPVAQLVPLVSKGETGSAPAPEASDSIFLFFSPTDQNRLLESDLDVCLVNGTRYDVSFSFSYKHQSEFVCLHAGGLNAGEVIELDTIHRGDLEQYATIRIDLIFFRKMPYLPIDPVSRVVRLKTVKFYKESTYAYHTALGKTGYREELFAVEKERAGIQQINPKEIGQMLRRKERGPRVSKSHAEGMAQLEREVDLHIDELPGADRAMTSAEKLEYQIGYFRQALEEALSSNIRKIIFIHGVGNGRLKSEIRKILDTYEGLRYYDASYKRYGFGATEVIIR